MKRNDVFSEAAVGLFLLAVLSLLVYFTVIVSGVDVLRGRSRCPACGHVLGPGDLIPVVSWLALRGKCRYCGGPIHWRYPVSEGTMALLTALCLARFDLTLLCLRNWILLPQGVNPKVALFIFSYFPFSIAM